jgi:predicted  nucleic acid-binding Zn-ribbon protein
VAQRKTQTTRRTGRQQPAAAGGEAALERLNASVEAAQTALKELRGELGRGSRELLQDVDVTLRDARKNLRRVSRQLVKDLEQVQRAAAGKRPGPQPTKATKATRRSPSRGTTTAAKRAPRK